MNAFRSTGVVNTRLIFVKTHIQVDVTIRCASVANRGSYTCPGRCSGVRLEPRRPCGKAERPLLRAHFLLREKCCSSSLPHLSANLKVSSDDHLGTGDRVPSTSLGTHVLATYLHESLLNYRFTVKSGQCYSNSSFSYLFSHQSKE